MFPAQIPFLWFLARFKVSLEESQSEHLLRVDISGPGVPRTPLGLATKAAPQGPTPSLSVEGGRLNCAIAMIGYTFPNPGEYTFHVVMDDKDISAMTLSLIALTPAGGET